jgi:hypothetical protein
MTTQDDTLAQLNLARDQLTELILGNTAVQGTPDWTKLENVLGQREQLSLQINKLLAATFPQDTPALQAAVQSATQATQQLVALDATLVKIDRWVALASQIVQAATAIVQLVT